MTTDQMVEEISSQIKLQYSVLLRETKDRVSPMNYLLYKVEEAMNYIRNSQDIEKCKDYAIMGSTALLLIATFCADFENKQPGNK